MRAKKIIYNINTSVIDIIQKHGITHNSYIFISQQKGDEENIYCNFSVHKWFVLEIVKFNEYFMHGN